MAVCRIPNRQSKAGKFEFFCHLIRELSIFPKERKIMDYTEIISVRSGYPD